MLTSKNYQKLILSCHRALLGAITPGIRALYILAEEVHESIHSINLRAVFESPPSEREKELLSIATSEIISDFETITSSSEEFIVINAESKLKRKPEEVLVYLRHEESNLTIESPEN